MPILQKQVPDGVYVDIGSRTQDIKARFFLLAGPLFISLILLAVTLKQGRTPLALPVTALAGLVACYLWKWRAVALSSLALMAALGLSLQSLHNHHWMWVTALALTIACTFVVTVLCIEESYREAKCPSDQDGEPQQTLSKYNEQLQTAQKQYAADLQEYSAHIDQLRQELAVKEDKIRSNEHLIRLVRDEMSATYTHQEKLMQDLHQTRQQLAKIEAVVGKDAEDFVADLDNSVATEEMQKQLDAANATAASLKQQLEQAAVEKGEFASILEKARSEAANLNEKANEATAALRTAQNDHLKELEAAKSEQEEALKEAISRSSEAETQLKQEITGLKQECDRLQAILSAKSEAEAKLNEEILSLQSESRLLEQKLKDAEDKLNQPVEPVIAVADDRELRRVEAMYQQLKQQFNEKTEVLAETRRELFLKEEQFLALQKDFEEAVIAHEYETGIAIESALSQAENERQIEDQWQQTEIEHLHELIDTLNRKISS